MAVPIWYHARPIWSNIKGYTAMEVTIPRGSKLELTDTQILNDIKTRPVVPVWPHFCWAHDCGRGKGYELARKGGPEFLRNGRMVKVLTGPLRKKLGIEG
jgi:hypothetical protein